VFLEDAGAAVVVDVVRQRIHDIVQPQLNRHARRALL